MTVDRAERTGLKEGISIVIPVYRSDSTLIELHKRACSSLAGYEGGVEFLFIDDNGSEYSREAIETICQKDTRAKRVILSRNFGQHNALLAGVNMACHTTCVTIDDDLQHRPEDIPLLAGLLSEDVDIAYGVPAKESHTKKRNLAAYLAKALLEAQGTDVKNLSAFRALKTDLRDGFKGYGFYRVNLDVLLSWVTTKIVSIEVPHDPRVQGKSGYNTRKLVRHTLNMMMGFSSTPLRIASYIGFAFSGFGIGVLIYALSGWLAYGSAIPGFTFLAAIIAIFSGAQLLTLGIIGEYLGRIYQGILGKPPHHIK